MRTRAKLLTHLLLLTSILFSSHAAAEISSFEFSPFRTAYSDATQKNKFVSGTVSFRLADSKSELSVPILWLREGKNTKQANGTGCCKHDFFSMDLQYRRYTSRHRNGLYAGLVLRGVTANGYVNDRFSRQTNFGAGVTLGYRHMYRQFFYWNVGVTAVSFANQFDRHDQVILDATDPYRHKHSITWDVLKIGILLP